MVIGRQPAVEAETRFLFRFRQDIFVPLESENMESQIMNKSNGRKTNTAASEAQRRLLKDQIRGATDMLIKICEQPLPSLGLDLDGTIDEAPGLFRLLAQHWPGKVFVITYRSDRAKAESDLKRFDIRYDQLILVDSFEAKAEVIFSNNIQVYFDDQPEMIQNVPSDVNVMLVRNGGNFDFDDKKWLFSKQTGKIV
jgi:hypothetical protein